MTASFLISIRDSVLALPSADRDRAAAVERNCSGPARPFFSQPFAMSGQLAGVISGVRFFFSRLIGVFQNSPRTDSYGLPGFVCLVRFASHDGQSIMRGFSSGQIRGFIKEHPSILKGVDWYKPGKDKALTLTGSLAKRIVRDLLSHGSRQRIEAALALVSGGPQTSAVESWTAAEVARRGMASAPGGQPRTVILAL